MKLVNTFLILSAIAGAVVSSPAPVNENLEYRVRSTLVFSTGTNPDIDLVLRLFIHWRNVAASVGID